MSVYTVHEPPLKRDQTDPDPDRFVFVRDGFYFWAFLFGPLWMLRHRLWLVLVLYLVLVVALEVGLLRLGAPGFAGGVVAFLLALLVGFEAATLRRWTLRRRRWRSIGVVIGDDLESAERRFFDAWVRDHAHPAAPQPAAAARAAQRAVPPPLMRLPAGRPDVVGLFPEPGAPR
jgi:hypothetical protein